jgi:hypothetical protein
MWHADAVQPWTIGLVAVIVVGLVVIVYGALSDRAKNRRAAVEMLSPPERSIPQFRPDSPAPTYLSELQARRRPAATARPELTPAERQQISEQTKDPSTVKLTTGYLSRDFVTDAASSQAVLDHPRVLVCAEGVQSTRELLTILEKLVLSGTALVVVAPSLSDEVSHTLEVNAIQQTMTLLAVILPASELQLVAERTGAQIRERSDLQAGYVWPEHLGGCERWISTAKNSYIVTQPLPSADTSGSPEAQGDRA